MEDDETKDTNVSTPSNKVDVENVPQDVNLEEQVQESVGGQSSTSIQPQSDDASQGPSVDEIQETAGGDSSVSVVPQPDEPLPDTTQEPSGGNSSSSVAAQQKDASLPDVKQESVSGNCSSSVTVKPVEALQGPLVQPHIEANKKVLTGSYSSPHIKLKDSLLAQVKDVKDANVPSSNASPLQHSKKEGIIDTTIPISSVKNAVSRFGGIVDWKAHKAHTMERRKFIQLELDKAHEEIPVFKRLCELAEEEKIRVLKKLSSSKRVNEELKLNLERAQLEEQQAKQDSELAILRMEELEQGIADEVSKAVKAQLEVARARLAAAVSELKTAQDELQQLQQDFTSLEAERASAVSKAKESGAESKEVAKRLENLSIELINTKDALETAQASHLEAEEQRTEKTSASEQDVVKFEKEMKAAQEELEKLTNKLSPRDNDKAQLATSLTTLQKLKGELGAYMESNLKKENIQETQENLENKNRGDMEAEVASAKKELEETLANVKTTMDEVNCLKESASSLEAELNRIKSEIALMQENEGKGVDLPDKLQHATEDAYAAKLLVELRADGYKKAKEEAAQAINEKTKVENRLLTAQKELEVSKACEKLASDATKALLPESESSGIINEDSKTKVTLSLEEYYGLNMRAHEAEEDAKKKELVALSEIDAAKESELESLNKLNEANNEIEQIKKELEVAQQKAHIAKDGKFHAEEELRKWRSEQETQKNDGNVVPAETSGKTSKSTTEDKKESTKKADPNQGTGEKVTKKKKRSIIPKFFMLMGKKKSSSKPS